MTNSTGFQMVAILSTMAHISCTGHITAYFGIIKTTPAECEDNSFFCADAQAPNLLFTWLADRLLEGTVQS